MLIARYRAGLLSRFGICLELILYEAFVDGELEAPRTLLPAVHRLNFEPEYPEFSP